MQRRSLFQFSFCKLESLLLLSRGEKRLGLLFLECFPFSSARRIVQVLILVSSSNSFLLTLRSDPTVGSSRSSTIRSSSSFLVFLGRPLRGKSFIHSSHAFIDLLSFLRPTHFWTQRMDLLSRAAISRCGTPAELIAQASIRSSSIDGSIWTTLDFISTNTNSVYHTKICE